MLYLLLLSLVAWIHAEVLTVTIPVNLPSGRAISFEFRDDRGSVIKQLEEQVAALQIPPFANENLVHLSQRLEREIAEGITKNLPASDPRVTPYRLRYLQDKYLQTFKLSITGLALGTPRFAGAEEGLHPWDPNLPYEARMVREKRVKGQDWPLYGLTMAGLLRLNTLEMTLRSVADDGVPGDFAELGVWRGGMSLFAKATLDALGDSGRKVHLFDSFEGLPRPSSSYDKHLEELSQIDYLRVSLEEVRSGFETHHLLDDSVVFHQGYFNVTVPQAVARGDFTGGRIAVLRLDGDMYESTLDALWHLFHMVSVGGYVIVDDWAVPECQDAITGYFTAHGLGTVIAWDVDGTSALFRKTEAMQVDPDRRNVGWYNAWQSSRTFV